MYMKKSTGSRPSPHPKCTLLITDLLFRICHSDPNIIFQRTNQTSKVSKRIFKKKSYISSAIHSKVKHFHCCISYFCTPGLCGLKHLQLNIFRKVVVPMTRKAW